MTALHTAPEAVRLRGSARLLAAWQEPIANPPGALAADLGPFADDVAGVADDVVERERWGRLLRRHGGRPLPPRAITDGVPVHVGTLGSLHA